MRELHIDSRRIADDTDCYVIAEIGNNHQGSLERALELIRAAKECGVDAVKFQKRDNRTLYTRQFYGSSYDSENSFGPTYGLHREALELGHHEWVELKRHAEELGVDFVAAAFDLPSADFLAELDIAAFKFASGDLHSTPLLEHVRASASRSSCRPAVPRSRTSSAPSTRCCRSTRRCASFSARRPIRPKWRTCT